MRCFSDCSKVLKSTDYLSGQVVNRKEMMARRQESEGLGFKSGAGKTSFNSKLPFQCTCVIIIIQWNMHIK